MTEYTMEEYYHDQRQSVLAGSEARQDFLENEFLLSLADELEGSGIIEGFEPCHYRAPRGMRVDGYWFKEDEAALDLFILDFENRESPESLTTTDVKSIFKRLENFFTTSVDKRLYEQLEESSPGYGLSRDIYDRQKTFSKVNLFLVSERLLSERIIAIDEIIYKHWIFSYHVWDISRFYRQQTARGAKEDLYVNFKELYGEGLPCIPAHLKNADYESYLLVMPAEILSDLYGKYGARLLEQNVRCFLQARGKVNKGIRATIMNNPEMFFAYNNGITATAKEVITENSSDKGICVNIIRDLQIVNGGQTTASLFHTKRKDKAKLDQAFVQVKLSVVDEEKSEEIIPKISEYANTQNKVNAADFFSNHPFHIRMEEFSRRLWVSPKDGALRETKWFYERARGQYADAQSKFTQAGRKKFQAENPKPQMFTKTDLAKFENVWDEKPTFVNLGGQKNFAKYAARIGQEWEKTPNKFNEFYYKCAISRAIIFRRAEKVISAQDWYQGGYRANIVAYSLALLSEYCKENNKSLDLLHIWKKQDVPDAIVKAIERVGQFVSDQISQPPEGISNISEWCKKDACWVGLQNRLSDVAEILPEQFIAELISKAKVKEDVKAAKKTQKIDDGINYQKVVLDLGSEKWKEIAAFGLAGKHLGQKDMGILAVATAMPAKIPSERQCKHLVGLLEKLKIEGLQTE